jgi:recombination protein RecR
MDPISKLSELFAEFPGIGERQAKRFAYYLLRKPSGFRKELALQLAELGDRIAQCVDCKRFFEKTTTDICETCRNMNTDKSVLMIIEKDTDYDVVRKSRSYNGAYFVLGGMIPILEKQPSYVRTGELLERIKKDTESGVLKEIILAFSLNTQGDHTDSELRRIIEPMIVGKDIRMTSLGRGLSTGTELEYSDSKTLEYALKNRQ